MENYKRVASSRTDVPPPMKKNEIRITAQGLSGNYVSYATSLFQDSNASEVVLTAMGRVICKAVLVAEILKKKIRGLHQNIELASSDVKDVWEPLEEGLNTLEMVRHVSMISVTLSTKELDVSSYGYQPPISTKQLQPLSDLNHEEGRRSGGLRTNGRSKDFERRNMLYAHAHNGPAHAYNNGSDENWNPGKGDYGAKGRGYGGGRGFDRGQMQDDKRSSNREFTNSFPLSTTRGYSRGVAHADARGYTHPSSQVNNRGQNEYYSQVGSRRYGNGYMQTNMRRYNQPQADERGYNGQRSFQQYNDRRLQGGNGSMYSQPLNYRGQGGNARGRGRGTFSR